MEQKVTSKDFFLTQICSEFGTEFVDGDHRGDESYEFERRHSGMNISREEGFDKPLLLASRVIHA